jgi:hypothetical protein
MGDPSNTVRHHREFSWSDQALNSSQMQQTLYYCCTNTSESSVDALSGAPKGARTCSEHRTRVLGRLFLGS